MDTVTAASVPAPIAEVPAGTVAAPGAGAPDLAVGGTTPSTDVTVPAGPAAQLRQAAFTSAAPDQRAALAIRTALAQIGLPYVWGGDGPTNGDAGFDCSGLTTFSYGTVGVLLPRTAHTQYNAGPHVPDGAALQPGDLVFYGTSARVHHVGMYLGAGRMVNAPTFGKPVQVAFYRYRGDDYLGATRPAAAGGSLTTGVLPYVDPVPAVPDVALAPMQREQQAQERVFQAPAASLPAVLPQPGDAALPSEQQSAAQAIAESDVVTGGRVAPRSFVAPAAVGPAAVDPQSGNASSGNMSSGTGSSGTGSDPVAGTTTSSSAPITSSPAPITSSPAPAPASSGAPAGVTTSASTETPAPVPPSPAGSATSATSTTSVLAAPTTESTTTESSTTPTSSATTSPSAPVVVEKVSGSTTATTTLVSTSTVRTTTPKATTSKVAKPVALKTTTTPSPVKTVTSPTTTAKAETTTSKPAAKTEDDPTTTTSASKASKTSKAKTTEEKTTEEKATKEKTSEDKTTAKKTSAEKTSTEKSS
jgi:cell wall-associated NlpC family hydrolase